MVKKVNDELVAAGKEPMDPKVIAQVCVACLQVYMKLYLVVARQCRLESVLLAWHVAVCSMRLRN